MCICLSWLYYNSAVGGSNCFNSLYTLCICLVFLNPAFKALYLHGPKNVNKNVHVNGGKKIISLSRSQTMIKRVCPWILIHKESKLISSTKTIKVKDDLVNGGILNWVKTIQLMTNPPRLTPLQIYTFLLNFTLHCNNFLTNHIFFNWTRSRILL